MRNMAEIGLIIDVNLHKGVEKMPNDQKAVRWHLADIAADEYKAGEKPQTKAYKREIQMLPVILNLRAIC